MEVDYVGNPVLDAIKAHQHDPNFLVKHKLINHKSIIALLPGSRKQELQRIIPVMAEVVALNPAKEFVVAAVKNLKDELYSPLQGFKNVTFVYEETYNLLAHSQAAIVTSGTATLETALFNVPQVVVYKANALTYCIVKLLIKVPFISLVNLISGKEVVKEMIQRNARGETISKELNSILNNKNYRENILKEYNVIIKMLDTGSASDNTARLMVNYLKG
jgi:lipid-A-disaccharide synthase